MTQNVPRENIRSLSMIVGNHFGFEDRLGKAVGECGEFVAAAQHWREGRDNALEGLIDEVADVTILMQQVSLLLGEVKVEDKIQEKLRYIKELIRKDRRSNGAKTGVIGQSRVT